MRPGQAGGRYGRRRLPSHPHGQDGPSDLQHTLLSSDSTLGYLSSLGCLSWLLHQASHLYLVCEQKPGRGGATERRPGGSPSCRGTVRAGILTAGDQVLVMQSRCSVGATSASVGELPRQAAPPKGSTRRSSTVFASKKSGPAAAPTTTAQSTRQPGRHVQVDLTVDSVPCVVARARSSRTELGRSLRPTARLCFRVPPRRVG